MVTQPQQPTPFSRFHFAPFCFALDCSISMEAFRMTLLFITRYGRKEGTEGQNMPSNLSCVAAGQKLTQTKVPYTAGQDGPTTHKVEGNTIH